MQVISLSKGVIDACKSIHAANLNWQQFLSRREIDASRETGLIESILEDPSDENLNAYAEFLNRHAAWRAIALADLTESLFIKRSRKRVREVLEPEIEKAIASLESDLESSEEADQKEAEMHQVEASPSAKSESIKRRIKLAKQVLSLVIGGTDAVVYVLGLLGHSIESSIECEVLQKGDPLNDRLHREYWEKVTP